MIYSWVLYFSSSLSQRFLDCQVRNSKKNIYCLIDQRCYVNPWLDFGHKRTKTLSPCLRWVFTGDMEFFGRPELGKLPFCRECSVTLCTADPIKAGNTARRIPLIALLTLSQRASPRASWLSVTCLGFYLWNKLFGFQTPGVNCHRMRTRINLCCAAIMIAIPVAVYAIDRAFLELKSVPN